MDQEVNGSGCERMTSRGFCWLAAAALCAAGIARAEEDELPFFVDGEIAVVQDSNPARAAWTRDIVEDSLANATLAVAWNREFGMMGALTLRAFADTEQYAELTTLSRTSFGAQGMFRWQRELGFTAPFYQVSLTTQSDDFDADLRDADRHTLQVFMTRRVTDAFRYSFGGDVWMQEANGKVFDGSQVRLFLNTDLTLADPWAVYGTYSIASGDTVSSARQVFCDGTIAGSDIYGIISAAEEIEPDQAMNADQCGTWLAYRLPALTHVFVGGLNRGFGHHLSFDLSVQHVMVFADGNNEYRRTLLRAGLVARF